MRSHIPCPDLALPARRGKLRAAGVIFLVLNGFGLSPPIRPERRWAQGEDGVAVGSRTVQKAMGGQAAPEDDRNDMRAVLNGG